MDRMSVEEVTQEIDRNYMMTTKLKDERILRLEEMLRDAHEALEKAGPDGSLVNQYSLERSLKAELARRDEVGSQSYVHPLSPSLRPSLLSVSQSLSRLSG
jgi:hypothetical protein